ncbi:MAG: DMT family transporter [Clostridia bacterium]|nr:DMT family transporter [Clostridia bacterium]
MSKSLKGSLLLLLTAFIWGTAFVFQRVGMDFIEPFTFNGVRNIVGAVALLPVIFLLSKLNISSKGEESDNFSEYTYIPGGIACGVILFAASSLQQIGLQYTTAGKAGFLTALYMVLVPIVQIFMRKYAGAKVWLCVIIATFGTYLLSVKDGFTVENGDIYVMLCAVVYTFHIIVIDYFSPKADAVKMSCVQFLTCGIISLAVAFIFETPTLDKVINAVIPILYTGIMSSGVAYTLQIIGQRMSPAPVACIVMSLESVFALLTGAVFLSESMTLREGIGCGLVFIAVILSQVDFRLVISYIKTSKEKLK